MLITFIFLGTPVTVQCLAHPASPPTSISSSSSTSTTSIRWQIDGTEVTSSNANFEMDSPSTSTSSQVYVSRTYFDVASLTMHTNLSFVVNSRQPSVRNVACIGNRYTATLRENWEETNWSKKSHSFTGSFIHRHLFPSFTKRNLFFLFFSLSQPLLPTEKRRRSLRCTKLAWFVSNTRAVVVVVVVGACVLRQAT